MGLNLEGAMTPVSLVLGALLAEEGEIIQSIVWKGLISLFPGYYHLQYESGVLKP